MLPPPQMHAHMHVLRSLHARCMAVGRGAKPPLMCALMSLAFDIIAPHCPLRCAARICRAVAEAGNSAADMTAATAVKGLEGQVLQLTSQVWLKWAQGGLVMCVPEPCTCIHSNLKASTASLTCGISPSEASLQPGFAVPPTAPLHPPLLFAVDGSAH